MSQLPNIKVYCAAGAELPQQSTSGSAALDVRACLPPDTVCIIPPGERLLIPTGLQFEIPDGYMISIRPRSGWALHSGMILPNAPATIDSDFRGELKILVMNLDQQKPIKIEHGDRIAQLLLERAIGFQWNRQQEPLERSSSTVRGSGGFGSTGLA